MKKRKTTAENNKNEKRRELTSKVEKLTEDPITPEFFFSSHISIKIIFSTKIKNFSAKLISFL